MTGLAAIATCNATGLALQNLDAKLARAKDRGLLEATASGWRPTELGRRFLNDLQASFLA